MSRILFAVALTCFPLAALADDGGEVNPEMRCEPDDQECIERARQQTAPEKTGVKPEGEELRPAAGERELGAEPARGEEEKGYEKTEYGEKESKDLEEIGMEDRELREPLTLKREYFLTMGHYVVVDHIRAHHVIHVHDANAVREASEGIEIKGVMGEDTGLEEVALEQSAQKVMENAKTQITNAEIRQYVMQAIADLPAQSPVRPRSEMEQPESDEKQKKY